jgi:pimeloyl-ACP methyl ester carboxylesterase
MNEQSSKRIDSNTATVVLVHGLWLHGIALMAQRHWLRRNGFFVRTFSYPSVRHSLNANSHALSCCISKIPGETIDLVGHSLGGLVILNMLAQTPDPRIRRVVLMGSPCGGSHCASVLLRKPWLSSIVGRSIRDSLMQNHWQTPAAVEIGVLAGNRSVGLGRIIPGLPSPNDGTVSVEETRLSGSRDRIVVPVSHSEMLISKPCSRQIASFLETGGFSHG